MTSRDLDDQIRRLQRLLGSRQPVELSSYLFVPDPAKVYVAGTSVPSLAPRVYYLPSGLYVPATASIEPAPSDLMRTYVTASELLGLPFRLAQAIDWFGRAHRETVLLVIAGLLAERQAIDADWYALDRAMVKRVLPEPHQTKALGLMGKNRVLLSPQGLLVAAKIALQVCPVTGADDLTMFIPAILAIQEDLTSEGPNSDDRLSPGGRLFREIVRSQAFHLETYERTQLITFQLRWRELPPSMPEPRTDLVAEFEAATGVPLDDLSALGTALWARAVERPGQPIPLSFLSSYHWEPARLERVLGLIAREPEEIGAMLGRDEEELGFHWSFDRLRQFPVVRLRGGDLLVLSPSLLFARVFGWLPVFDAIEGWRTSGDDRRAQSVVGSFRRVCERQALESLRAIAGGGPAKRLFDEGDLRRAFGLDHKVADAAYDAGPTWIVVEVSTRQLQRGARGGDSEADLSVDLERGVYKKVEQLDATIHALREDERRLTGAAVVTGRRFIPVLVATEGFPVNPMTTAAIEREIANRGLLAGALVGSLRIISQEELDMVESIVESGQAGLLDLLEGWGRARLRSMDLKSWLLSTRFDPKTPRRLEGAFHNSWQPALRALGEHDEIEADGAG